MHSEIPARCSGKARIGAKTPAWWPETFPQLEPVGFKKPILDCGLYLMKKKMLKQHLSFYLQIPPRWFKSKSLGARRPALRYERAPFDYRPGEMRTTKSWILDQSCKVFIGSQWPLAVSYGGGAMTCYDNFCVLTARLPISATRGKKKRRISCPLGVTLLSQSLQL